MQEWKCYTKCCFSWGAAAGFATSTCCCCHFWCSSVKQRTYGWIHDLPSLWKEQNLISFKFWLEEGFWCWHLWNGTIENTNNITLPLPRVFTVRPCWWVRRPLHVLTRIHTITTAAGKTDLRHKNSCMVHAKRRYRIHQSKSTPLDQKNGAPLCHTHCWQTLFCQLQSLKVQQSNRSVDSDNWYLKQLPH